MGGMATIPTTAYSAAATAANGGRYPGVTNENSGRFPNDLSAAPSPYQPHDYYSHQNYAGLNAQSASSHSPTGIERSFQFIFSTLTQIVEQLRGLLIELLSLISKQLGKLIQDRECKPLNFEGETI